MRGSFGLKLFCFWKRPDKRLFGFFKVPAVLKAAMMIQVFPVVGCGVPAVLIERDTIITIIQRSRFDIF